MAHCTISSRKEASTSFANSSFPFESLLLGGLHINNKKGAENNFLTIGGGLRLRSMSVGVSVDVGKYNTRNICSSSANPPVDLHQNNKSPEISDSDSDDMDGSSHDSAQPLDSKDDKDTSIDSISQASSKELDLEDLASDNKVSEVSSPVRQSGSYPRSLKECGGENKNSMHRSNSTPVISTRTEVYRRVIFPSIHPGKPKETQNKLKFNSISKDNRYSLLPPRRKKSSDNSILESAFNDSLNLNYFHESEKKFAATSKDENSQSSESCKLSPTTIIPSNETINLTYSLQSNCSRSILRKPRYSLNKSSNNLNINSSPRIPVLPKIMSRPSDDTLSCESSRDIFRNKSASSHYCSQQDFKMANDDKFRRINSEECLSSGNFLPENKHPFDEVSSSTRIRKKIKFDPRVWVVEFKRPNDENIWFTSVELEKFKTEAIRLVQKREMKMISSGTGRVINVRPTGNAAKAVFTNPALSTYEDDDEDDSNKSKLSPSSLSFISANNTETFQKILISEIKSVLVVDPHDLFLKLITKGIMMMLPHVSVTSAHSTNEAFGRIFDAREKAPLSDGGCTHGFDLIIIEERLSFHQKTHCQHTSDNSTEQRKPDHQFPDSGSELVHNIKCEERNMLHTWKKSNWWRSTHPRVSLLIGMSAHLDQDSYKMKRGGADMMWGKPPPPLNNTMRRDILRLLLKKRDRKDIHLSAK